jgi:hypothetical protein
MHVIWAPIKTYNIYNVPIFDTSVGLFYINVPAISENKNKNTSLEERHRLGKVIARVYEDRFANWASHLVLAMASYEPAWK